MKKILYAGIVALLALSACKKDNNNDAPKPDGDMETNWQFTANDHTFAGPVKGGTILYFGGAQVTLAGFPASGAKDTSFSLSIQFPTNRIDTGTYATTDIGTNFTLLKSNGDVIFAATALEQGNVVKIKVTAYDSVKQVISGSFSGLPYDYDGNNVPVTNGSFKAVLTKVN